MGLEKINELKKEQGMDLETLSSRSGVPYGTLSKIAAGITKDPKLETVKAIARALGVSLDVFDDVVTTDIDTPAYFDNDEQQLIKKYRSLDGSGKELIRIVLNHEYERSENDLENRIPEIISEAEAHYTKIIPFPGKVSAGIGVETIENYDTITGPDNADLALVVDGDSMAPRFQDGQVIYIRQQATLDNGQIGVVQVQTEDDFIPRAYLKKIQREGNSIRLISINDSYEDVTVPATAVTVLGVVI